MTLSSNAFVLMSIRPDIVSDFYLILHYTIIRDHWNDTDLLQMAEQINL